MANVGSIDRVIRILIGIGLAVTAYMTGLWWLYIIGGAAIATGIVGWCGIYSLFGMNTCKVK
jgi:hypothetical protein